MTYHMTSFLLPPLMNSKPLNPNADSWFPHAKNPSFLNSQHEIYIPTAIAAPAVVPVPIPATALYQESVPFPFSHHEFQPQISIPFESAAPSGYYVYYTFPPENKQILNVTEKQKLLRNKNVPPRLRRKCFIEEDFKEKKITNLPPPPPPTIKQIWKPKNEEELRSPVRHQITTVMLKNVPNQYR